MWRQSGGVDETLEKIGPPAEFVDSRMNEIEAEVDDAVRVAGIGTERWRKLPLEQAREICSAVRERFVDGDPRAWWLALKQPFESHSFPHADGSRFVHLYVPPGEERCWFIPDTEEADLPVYEVAVSDVPCVLAESQCFEYYLVGERLEWMVAENDHNEVLVVRPVPEAGPSEIA